MIPAGSTMTFTPDTARAWVDVDLGALVANARTLAGRLRQPPAADGQS